jgi:hypothetical protein
VSFATAGGGVAAFAEAEAGVGAAIFACATGGGVLLARGAGAGSVAIGSTVAACDNLAPRFTTGEVGAGFVTCHPIHPTSASPTIERAITAASRASIRRGFFFRLRGRAGSLKTGRVKFDRALPR